MVNAELDGVLVHGQSTPQTFDIAYPKPDVATMPQLQRNQVLTGAVGQEPGDPVAVGVSDAQLRSRVRALLTQDQPAAGRPGG